MEAKNISPEGKKVKLDLTKVDGNAFSLMAAFQRQAKAQGWTNAEINLIIQTCMSSDYTYLVATLAAVCH